MQIKMTNRTQVCNLKIWIKGALSLSKARGVITENILLMKYIKQAIIAALNGEDTHMLLPTALRKCWICQVLHFIVNQDTSLIRNKVPNQEFDWGYSHGFYSRLGVWTCKSVWSVKKFVRKFMLLFKNESSLEKKSFSKVFFFKQVEIQQKNRKITRQRYWYKIQQSNATMNFI